jgi:type VI secretion system secreted protein Hcp
MFLKLAGVNGESGDKVHKNEIDILAWSWGMSNTGSTHVGGGGGSGKVSVQDMSLTKWVDLASTTLMTSCCDGKHYDSAVLTVRKAGTTPLEYLVITLTEVMVTSVSTGGSGGEDRLTENISLNFRKFQVDYKEQTTTGAAGATPTMNWDIQANASS